MKLLKLLGAESGDAAQDKDSCEGVKCYTDRFLNFFTDLGWRVGPGRSTSRLAVSRGRGVSVRGILRTWLAICHSVSYWQIGQGIAVSTPSLYSGKHPGSILRKATDELDAILKSRQAGRD